MSQRSQVANSGSRPIEACSAACAAPGTSAAAEPGPGQAVRVDGPPDRAGPQVPGRQVERLLAEHLAGDHPAAQEGDDLVGHLDGPERQRDVLPRRGWSSVSTTSMSVTSRAVVVSPGRPGSTIATCVVEVERATPGRSRPGARRPRRRATVACAAPPSTVPSSRPVSSSTRPTGRPPTPRMSARSLARSGRVQNSPAARRRSSPRAHEVLRPTSAACGPNSARSSSVSGSSAAAAHRCGART